MKDKEPKLNVVLVSPKNSFKRLDIMPFVILYPILFGSALVLPIPIWIAQFLPGIFLISQALTFLLSYWSVHMKARIRYEEVTNIRKATYAMITKYFKKENRYRTLLCKVHDSAGYFIEFFKQKYIYNEDSKIFIKKRWNYDKTFEEYCNSLGMINERMLNETIREYGNNVMDIPMPSILELYREHIVAPFFVFQVFFRLLWLLEEYWYFSLMSLGMLFVFEGTVVFSRLKNMERIRGMRIKHRKIKVFRERNWTTINSAGLVPGDIVCIEVEDGGESENRLPCDMLLLSGNCTVNEAILTGEAIPLAKEPITQRDSLQERFSLKSGQHKSHILFGRTEILHCSRELGQPLGLPIPPPPSNRCCIAYVLRTGFETTQGKLVRTVLFTAERVTVESKEAYKFLFLLLFFAIIAAGYTLWEGLRDPERNKHKVVVKSIMILATVVPPELPMELSISVNSSIMSLIMNGIFCTEPYRIPLAGRITTCCFDKTGTLTSSKIRISGIIDKTGRVMEKVDRNAKLVLGLCNGLTLGDVVIGDPMEKLAYEETGWKYDRGKEMIVNEEEGLMAKAIVKYSFTSQLKRMSVIAAIKSSGNQFNKILTKGAPEVIKEMLIEVPHEFDSIVNKFAKEGSRLICMAYKDVDNTARIARSEAESNLIFCGFMTTNCPLKKDSKKEISNLLESRHRIVIITGDNQYTAAHACFELGISNSRKLLFLRTPTNDNTNFSLIDLEDNVILSTTKAKDIISIRQDLCITGYVLEYFNRLNDWTEEEKAAIINKGIVFARVSPSQKDYIVGVLNRLGEFTLMCGDGTNDVGSLKRAHAGIALLNKEETEEEKKRNRNRFMKAMAEPVMADGDASIAAPFTYRYDSIKSAVTILRQGRCALVSTIQMYKMLGVNCLMLACSLSFLYHQGLKSGDWQSVYFGIPIAIYFYFISNAKPLDKLHPQKPPHTIFSFYQLMPIAMQLTVHIGGLVFLTKLGNKYTKPEELPKPDGKFVPTILNTVVMIYLSFVDATNSFINYEGEPFMEPLWKGKALPTILIVHMVALVIASLDWSVDLRQMLELKELPADFPSHYLIGTMIIDFLVCFGIRKYVRWKLYNI